MLAAVLVLTWEDFLKKWVRTAAFLPEQRFGPS